MDKHILEIGLPVYLQKDLNAFIEGIETQSTLIDCLWGELYGSINSAACDKEISEEQADYLMKTYLFE